MCGEQPSPPPTRGGDLGSPPRVRGTGLTGGETVYAQDHPRVCGEQLRNLADAGADAGSPPRVRGTAGFSAV